jgi:hypothetical protein
MRNLLLALALLLAASCSKVSEENFAKVREGMSEQEVIALLGAPTESNSVSVLGVSGTTARWAGGGAEITIPLRQRTGSAQALRQAAGQRPIKKAPAGAFSERSPG